MRTLLSFVLLSLSIATHPAAGQQEPPSADETLNRVLSSLESGELEPAITLLEEARSRGETDFRVLQTLGALYLEANRPTDAISILKPMADSPAAEPAVLYNAGRAAAAIDDLDKAAEYLERSLAISPVTPAARELGFVRLRQGHLMDAYLVLRPWSRLHPEDNAAVLAAASSAVALGRASEAEELLAGLPLDDPRANILRGRVGLLNDDGWGALAWVKPVSEDPPPGLEGQVMSVAAESYLLIGQPQVAVEMLSGKAGEDPDLLRLLSLAQAQTGDQQQALRTLQPVAERLQVNIGPDSPDADKILAAEILADYGRMLSESGRTSESIPSLERATSLDPSNADPWEWLSEALAAQGRDQESLEALATSQAIRGTDSSSSASSLGSQTNDSTGARLRWAMHLSGKGNRETALKIVRQEQILAPGDPRSTLLEARLLSDLGRLQEALNVAESAVEMAPDLADSFYMRGVVRLDLGLSGPAEKDLRQTLAMAPQHTAAMNDLAVLLMARGDIEEARFLLEQVLILRPEDPLAAENLRALAGSDPEQRP
jgi:tetratricopeptide (TPR) repeat protein